MNFFSDAVLDWTNVGYLDYSGENLTVMSLFNKTPISFSAVR